MDSTRAETVDPPVDEPCPDPIGKYLDFDEAVIEAKKIESDCQWALGDIAAALEPPIRRQDAKEIRRRN